MAKILKVCPATANKFIDQGNACFLCTGCNKLVMDFRNKSLDEIEANREQFSCGIFDKEQLSHTPYLGIKKRWIYRVLVAASFLGFQIAPIEADAQHIQLTNGFHSKNSSSEELRPRKKVKRSKKVKRNKRVIYGAWA